MADVSIEDLIPLGFFREFGSSRSTGDSILDFVSDKPSPHQDMIVNYLRNGERMGWTMERSHDVIDGSFQPDSAAPVTDGRWVWRADLAHYVERHNLRLPKEFVDTVTERKGVPPKISPEQHRQIGLAWFGLNSDDDASR